MADRGGSGSAPERALARSPDVPAELADDAVLAAQRLMMVGEIAASVAHDVRNVFALIQGSATLLELGGADALPERLDAIRDAVKRGNMLTRQLLDLALPPERTKRGLEVAALVTRALPLLKRLLPGTVQVSPESPDAAVMAVAEASLAQQILLGLAVNLGVAMPGGGSLVLRSRLQSVSAEVRESDSLAPGDYAVVELVAVPSRREGVQNSEVVSRGSRPASSLALSTARAIARREGGDVREGDALSFLLFLPAASAG